jgi:hypothetical protein
VASYNGEDYVIKHDYQNNIFRDGMPINTDFSSFINVIGGHVYYIASMPTHMEIVQTGLNGENRTVLYSEPGVYLSNLLVSNDAVYFLESGERIIRLHKDSGGLEIIFTDEEILDFAFLSNGAVVFSKIVHHEHNDDCDDDCEELLFFAGSKRALYVFNNGIKTLISSEITSYDVNDASIYYSDTTLDAILKFDYINDSNTVLLNDWTANRILYDDECRWHGRNGLGGYHKFIRRY